jgi:hypothetical protein
MSVTVANDADVREQGRNKTSVGIHSARQERMCALRDSEKPDF